MENGAESSANPPEEEEKLFGELEPQIQTICHLILNTGMRPPQEILMAEKFHVNLSAKSQHYRYTRRDGAHLEGKHVFISSRSILVVHGKGGRVRQVPLNDLAYSILTVLCADSTTGNYLFKGRGGKPLASIKKGWQGACKRAGIDDLRPYHLRHTFATRLGERGVPIHVISALLGHKAPTLGFGHESRITPGYTHVPWETMVWAVKTLAGLPLSGTVFDVSRRDSGKSQANGGENQVETRKERAG